MASVTGTLEHVDLVASATGVDQITITNPITTTGPGGEAPVNTTNSAEAEIETPAHPKGIRFVILFLAILAGDFFVGYVCNIMNFFSALSMS